MNGSDSGWAVGLDDEQKVVAGAPVAERQVVTAGPGTGKTRTLLARANYLFEEAGLDRSGEFVILSFSRAAVDTVARRSDETLDIGRLPIRTLDSFAAKLLTEAGESTDHMSFDNRIKAATDLVSDSPDLIPSVAELRHVLVDEAQDIVGVRHGFMKELLDCVTATRGSGFTVLGDSAQAIYEFQETDGVVAPGPARFLRWLIDCAAVLPNVIHRQLTTNYRMKSNRLRELAEGFGEDLRSDDVDFEEIWGDLDFEIGEDHGWGDIADAPAVVREVRTADKSVAVLCRSNAEVLVLGSALHSEGVDLRVNHRAIDRGAAPWIAHRFSRSPVDSVKFERVDEDGVKHWLRTPSGIKLALRREGLMRADNLDLARLARALRMGACPESLIATRESSVVISTIHRAKGQEFDAVFAVKERPPRPDSDFGEEARVLYVAATRARDDLCQCSRIELGGPVRSADWDERVTVNSWHRKERPRLVEVRVSDSDAEWYAGGEDRFWEIQAHLVSGVSPGDYVDLRLVEGLDSDIPIYDAWHRSEQGSERVFGRTNEEFGVFIKERVWGRSPTVIDGLVAETPDTASMRPANAKKAGLADHGLHLRARFYGLGRLEWNDV